MQVCTVFAQLTVNGKWEGPHVFVVRIRDDNGGPIKGVKIEDCGSKMGLQVRYRLLECVSVLELCFVMTTRAVRRVLG